MPSYYGGVGGGGWVGGEGRVVRKAATRSSSGKPLFEVGNAVGNVIPAKKIYIYTSK